MRPRYCPPQVAGKTGKESVSTVGFLGTRFDSATQARQAHISSRARVGLGVAGPVSEAEASGLMSSQSNRPAGGKRQLGRILLQRKVVSAADLDTALGQQKRTPTPVPLAS